MTSRWMGLSTKEKKAMIQEEQERIKDLPNGYGRTVTTRDYQLAMDELATALDENNKIKAQAKQDADILKSDLLIFARLMERAKKSYESKYTKDNLIQSAIDDGNDPSLKVVFTFDPGTGKLIDITARKE